MQAVIKEYEGYSKDEIIRFIDADTIKEDILVSDLPAKITDAGTEMSSVYEKTVFYDIHFKALNPKLTSNSIEVRLHIDFEVQNEYVPTNPKYPIVKRAIYYAAREISSQLGVLTEKTNYNDLLQYLEGVFTSDLHKMCSNCSVQKYAEPHIS